MRDKSGSEISKRLEVTFHLPLVKEYSLFVLINNCTLIINPSISEIFNFTFKSTFYYYSVTIYINMMMTMMNIFNYYYYAFFL